MTKYKFVVYWEMRAVQEVEAETKKEAIRKILDLPLPEDGQYVQDTFNMEDEDGEVYDFSSYG